MKLIAKKYNFVIIELLYRLRLSAGITQQQLSDILKVPQSYVSKIETGERRIDLIELREICRALNSDLIEFVVMLEKELNETQS